MALTINQIKEKVNFLRGRRHNFEQQWQEIADYMLPRKNTVQVQRSPGEKRNVQILDNTGMNSLELLAGALHGMLTNPNAMWFELTTGDFNLDKEDDVRLWLQNTTRIIHNSLNNSNFQTEVHELYLDLCGFGTGCMLIEEDDQFDIRFHTQFIGEYFIAEDHLGRVNQIYREWKWDAAKIVNFFGEKNVHQKVMDAYKKGSNDTFTVCHAVYPKDVSFSESSSPHRYISHYVLPEYDHVLRLSGFNEFPFVVPRWAKATGEMYGTSPGMIALPEVKAINKMEEIVLNGAQKVIDPPIQLPDDGYVLPIITRPGGINYRRSGADPIAPIFNDTRIDFGFEVTNRKRMRIRESFYVDQLQLQQGPAMTATEVLQRTEEKMRLLGPLLGRQQAEFLRPMIDRVFAILVRRGKIPLDGIPAQIQGRVIDVRYSSMVAKSQRLSEGQSVLRTFQAAAPFMQIDPSSADIINSEKAIRVLAEVYGLPAEIIRTQREIDTIRESRAEAQAAQAQMQREMVEVEQMKGMAEAQSKIQQ